MHLLKVFVIKVTSRRRCECETSRRHLTSSLIRWGRTLRKVEIFITIECCCSGFKWSEAGDEPACFGTLLDFRLSQRHANAFHKSKRTRLIWVQSELSLLLRQGLKVILKNYELLLKLTIKLYACRSSAATILFTASWKQLKMVRRPTEG